MDSQKKKITTKLDPMTAQVSYESVAEELATMPPSEVMTPNSDAAQGAVAGLALSDVMDAPGRAKRFEGLPTALLSKNASKRLRAASLATWYTATCLQDQQVLETGVKVSIDVMDRALKLRAKLQRQLEYHLDDLPQAMAQLADIRTGTGYQDTASDLSRLGRLHAEHEARLAGDRRYDANDGAAAQVLATEILDGLRASMGREIAEWTDKRNRAWTAMASLYAEIIAAAQFVFRKEPNELALFVPLRAAATVNRRSAAPVDEAPVVVPEAPPVTGPAPASGAETGNGAAHG
jgi:hypothetical protein